MGEVAEEVEIFFQKKSTVEEGERVISSSRSENSDELFPWKTMQRIGRKGVATMYFTE